MLDVLVVDDDAGIRQLLDINVQLLGHAVRTAATAEEALLRSAERRPDVLLLDISLPGMSGDDLVSWLDRGLGRPRHVVFVSALPADRIQDLAARHEVDWLPKPLDIERLEQILVDVESTLSHS